MSVLQTGVIRLAYLASPGGAKVKTFYLPPPSRGMPTVDWEDDADTVRLVGGGRRTRRDGYVPVLAVRWNVYDDRAGQGYAIGTADGQRPALDDLLWYLSQPSGMLRVSPGLTAGGFTVDRVEVKPVGKRGEFYTGLEVTFRGRDAMVTRTLEAF